MPGEETPSGFKVSDRRSFTDSGETRADGTSTPPASIPSPASTPAESAAKPARNLPPVDFHTFIISLGSSALLHLGHLEDPEAGLAKTAPDLTMAKHTIDLLDMLQAKTKGNLTGNEQHLLDSLLYDLRLRFIEASKR